MNYITFFDFCKRLVIIDHMKIKQLIKTAAKKILPKPVIGAYHLGSAWAGAVWFRFPSRHLRVIGVTGTNGKSTTAMMIARILAATGGKIALSSSIEFRIGKESWQNRSRMTMPGGFVLQRFLRRAADQKCRYAIIEVSSEGIEQHRHCGIDFEAAVITNLTPEHIEAHGGFDNYRAAKGKLFAACKKIHILNQDDESYDYLARFGARKKYVYGIAREVVAAKPGETAGANENLIEARNIKTAPELSFEIGARRFNLPLLGAFNVYNALAAIAAARSQGVDWEICQRALAGVKSVPGRMERIAGPPFEAFIDYAVTPDSLKKAYQTMREGLAGKLICVLGACGGGRDKWKRPVMGDLAKRYCDHAIITSEDPYDENPEAIIDQIAGKIRTGGNIEKIADRRRAIERALSQARAGDRVIITGKGCEDSMCVAGGKRIPWSDKAIVLAHKKRRRSD